MEVAHRANASCVDCDIGPEAISAVLRLGWGGQPARQRERLRLEYQGPVFRLSSASPDWEWG